MSKNPLTPPHPQGGVNLDGYNDFSEPQIILPQQNKSSQKQQNQLELLIYEETNMRE